jgi:hypothetical protein
MKKLLVLSLLLIIAAIASSQVVLTFSKNGLFAGDSVYTQEIKFISPGNSGPDQIWDFSKIEFTGNNPVSLTSEMPLKHLDGLDNSNLILNDHGYEYYLNSNKDILEELGLTSKDYSFVFSDPMLKMKYPFSYGENFTDKYSGTGYYREDKKVDISGNYTVFADGYGTIILPDKILKNAMRLRIEETGTQLNPCNSIDRKIQRYLWYVPNAKHAVLGFTISEYTFSGEDPKITYTGFINQKMYNSFDLNTAATNLDAGDLAESSVVLFPNPFNKRLSYNYFLREQMQVSVELVNISGSRLAFLLDNKVQQEGMHTGEFDASSINLPMGVYYLRFTFGKKVVVSKVVKI